MNNNKYYWTKGDLIICTSTHTIVSVSEEEKSGFGNRTTTLEKDTIMLAIENTPNPGSLSKFKIVYNNSLWWANGNYFKFCSVNKND